MRKLIALTIALTAPSFTALAMDGAAPSQMEEKPTPAYAKTILGRLFHAADRSIDPLTYLTQGDSIKTCKAVLRLNPKHPDPILFERDKVWLTQDGYIAKAIHRQQKLLYMVEVGIFGDALLTMTGRQSTPPSHTVVEQIRNSYPNIAGYFSPYVLAVINGYYEYKGKQDAQNARVYKRLDPITDDKNVAEALAAQPIEEKKPAELLPAKYIEKIDYEEFCNLVNKDNSGWWEKINNTVRKKYLTSDHLTHDKTSTFGEYVLRFDPKHPGHNSSHWELSPDRPTHHNHVHKVFNREFLLINAINVAIESDDDKTLRDLNYMTIEGDKSVTVPEGYYSPIIKAILDSYFHKKNHIVQKEITARQEKEAAQKAAALAELQKKEREEKEAKQKAELEGIAKETAHKLAQEKAEAEQKLALDKINQQRAEAEKMKALQKLEAEKKAQQEQAAIREAFEKAEKELAAKKKEEEKAAPPAGEKERPKAPSKEDFPALPKKPA